MKKMIILMVVLMMLAPAVMALDGITTIMRYPAEEDLNGNHITDQFDTFIHNRVAQGKADLPVRVIVTFMEPVTDTQLTAFSNLNGKTDHIYDAALYGFAGEIPVGNISKYAAATVVRENLCIITDDPIQHANLDHAVQEIRARPAVWNAGYTGNSSTTIAILDTGVDDSHTDFSGRISAGWHDFSSDGYTTQQDNEGHGSHVAGIALGSGAVYSGFTSGFVSTSYSDYLASSSGYADDIDIVEVKATGSSGLQIHLYWDGTGTAGITSLNTAWNQMSYTNSGTSPVSWSSYISTTGTYRPLFFNDSGAGNRAFTGVCTYRYVGPGDGYNLFTGVAPGAHALGVKVLADSGSSYISDAIDGINYCINNRNYYNIRVINMSLGMDNGATNSSYDSAANNAVLNGIVVACSAGNDYPSYTVASPGNAANVITVGAINDSGKMTNYSSNGSSGQNKPDVVAPGGSMVEGSLITSVETNDGDAYGDRADQQANDYTNFQGTSMSSPVIAGLAGLLIDVQESNGDTWNYTSTEARRIKMIILMTATETNMNGEMNWNGGGVPTTPSGNDPPLNRGARDTVEGYGKANADAAMEAFTQDYTFSGPVTFTFGSGITDRKATTYRVNLTNGTQYDFDLVVPAGSDYDLYLYRSTPTTTGNPVILASSTSATAGQDEHIASYTATSTGLAYVVAKRVTGSGQGELTITDLSGPTSTPGTPTNTPLATSTPTPAPTSSCNEYDYFLMDNDCSAPSTNFYGICDGSGFGFVVGDTMCPTDCSPTDDCHIGWQWGSGDTGIHWQHYFTDVLTLDCTRDVRFDMCYGADGYDPDFQGDFYVYWRCADNSTVSDCNALGDSAPSGDWQLGWSDAGTDWTTDCTSRSVSGASFTVPCTCHSIQVLISVNWDAFMDYYGIGYFRVYYNTCDTQCAAGQRNCTGATPTNTPTNTPTHTPTHTPTAAATTPAPTPIPTSGPVGIGILIFLISLFMGFVRKPRRH